MVLILWPGFSMPVLHGPMLHGPLLCHGESHVPRCPCKCSPDCLQPAPCPQLTWRVVAVGSIGAGVGGRPVCPQRRVPLTAVCRRQGEGAPKLRMRSGWRAEAAGPREKPWPCCGKETQGDCGPHRPPFPGKAGSGHPEPRGSRSIKCIWGAWLGAGRFATLGLHYPWGTAACSQELPPHGPHC